MPCLYQAGIIVIMGLSLVNSVYANFQVHYLRCGFSSVSVLAHKYMHHIRHVIKLKSMYSNVRCILLFLYIFPLHNQNII